MRHVKIPLCTVLAVPRLNGTAVQSVEIFDKRACVVLITHAISYGRIINPAMHVRRRLQGNSLTGPLPPELSRLSRLQWL